MADMPPDLDPGVYGFAAQAVDESCTVYAAGCTEITLPGPTRVVTTLVASAESPLCAEAQCSAGRCDADVGDGGVRDVGGDVPDARDPDTGDSGADAGCVLSSDCGDCASCDLGRCVPRDDGLTCTGGVCAAGLCCLGCLQDGVCQDGTTPEACGGGGDNCATCECPTDACVAGACGVGHVVEDVAAGAVSTCVLVGGSLSCFGDNRLGQLALGELTAGSATPVASPSTLRFEALADGDDHYLGLVGGEVFSWGDNEDTQLGYGAARVPSPTPTRVGSLTGVTAIDAGSAGDISCALLGSRLLCFGQNNFHQVSPLTEDSFLTPTEVAGGPWLEVGMGHHHVCAVTVAGELFCWGRNQSGQLGLGDSAVGSDQAGAARVGTDSNWALVEGGDTHTCAIDAAGAVSCWGDNSRGALGDGTSMNRTTPTPIADDASFLQVEGGVGFTCALRDDRTLLCWGANNLGQLGRGTISTRALSPDPAGGFDDWIAYAVGEGHVCAVREGGSLYCWGGNDLGQLGVGDFTRRDTPTPVCW